MPRGQAFTVTVIALFSASRAAAFTVASPLRAAHPHLLSRVACLRVRGGSSGARMASDGPLEGGNVLYCKRGPQAGSMGDCPFTQKANLALRVKGFEPRVAYVDLANKPQWFLDLNKAGTAPTYITQSGEVLTESDDIMAFADKEGSGPQLLGRAGGEELWAVAKQVFPAFAAVLKNKEAADEAKLMEDLKAKLAALDSALGSGPLLLGEEMSEVDCRLAPFLFHINSALPHYKKVELLSQYPKISKYFEAVSKTPAFQQTSCPPETVVWGWSAKVGIAL
jgi:glutathione S-transferase